MQFASLDILTRRWLLDRNHPIHFYMEVLFHASTCVRELNKDTLQLIQVANIPINSYGAGELPDGFMDDVACSVSVGGRLRDIPRTDDLNPLRIHSTTTGAFSNYTTNPAANEGETVFGLFPASWSWFWNVNEFGEPTGRAFGAGGGTDLGYQIFRERRQIQMTDGFQDGNAILLFIGNGQSLDNATQVDWRAAMSISAFVDWQRSPNATNENSPEGYRYYNEKRKLRAAMSDLGAIDIKNIIRKNYRASIKS